MVTKSPQRFKKSAPVNRRLRHSRSHARKAPTFFSINHNSDKIS